MQNLNRKNKAHLEPPVALITGGAHRLGAAICQRLHRKGWRVIIHCHQSRQDADRLAAQLNQNQAHSAHVISHDLSDLGGLATFARRCLSQWGRIDALINNAAQFYPTPIGDLRIEDWQRLSNTNAAAPLFLAQALQQALQDTNGSVVNIIDIYHQRPLPDHAIYCASKAALQSITLSLAQQMAPAVRVNAVAPGAILWPSVGPGESVSHDYQEALLARIPLQRLGQPQDIAQAVDFLLQADYITGQILAVDGGRSTLP